MWILWTNFEELDLTYKKNLRTYAKEALSEFRTESQIELVSADRPDCRTFGTCLWNRNESNTIASWDLMRVSHTDGSVADPVSGRRLPNTSAMPHEVPEIRPAKSSSTSPLRDPAGESHELRTSESREVRVVLRDLIEFRQSQYASFLWMDDRFLINPR
jgi:hypothetical protein